MISVDTAMISVDTAMISVDTAMKPLSFQLHHGQSIHHQMYMHIHPIDVDILNNVVIRLIDSYRTVSYAGRLGNVSETGWITDI